MKKRMPWSVGRAVLREVGLPTSMGWDKSIEKIAADNHGQKEPQLLDALEEHILCGEKFTKIYEVSKTEHTEAQEFFADADTTDSPYASAFPLPLPDGEMEKLDGTPILTRVIKNDDGIGGVFCNWVKITTREKIQVSEYTDDPSRFTSQFDEIVGLKFENVQLFNVVWVPHGSPAVEVRTDYPDGMKTDEAHAIQSTVRRTFNDLMSFEIDNPIDLFGLLEAMYNDVDEGQVVELGFTTTTASVKQEKMRKPNTDLRTEKYHMSGKNGLGTPIEPYRMSIRWPRFQDDLKLVPELTLAGTARGRSNMNTPGAVGISGASIRNCAGRADYEFVVQRIRHHLAAQSSESSPA